MDTFNSEQRSAIMRAIKSSDTRLEIAIRSALWKGGLRYRKKSSLPGKPDMTFIGAKTVVFIDSCFWHGCPDHCRMPKSNAEYWTKKIRNNRERDLKINKKYQEIGWIVIRVWEHQLNEDFEKLIRKIDRIIRECYLKQNNSEFREKLKIPMP